MIRSPRTPLRRLVTLVAATTVTVLALAGCSTGTATTSPTDGASGSAASDSFPVTIPNAFGDTTIDAKPERVVTWGWGSADAALAMGVVPVAIPFQSYGGDENGVLPWIQDQLTTLGADTPTVLPDSTDEPPYEAIQKAAPDVILAPYSGITKEQYDLLSQIAPTVAYPETAWSTPWRDVITIVGKALGESAKAQGVLDGIDAQLKTEADAHPEFAGKSIAAVWDTAGTFYVYKKEDPRVETLLDLGFTSAPSVDDLANGDQTFYYTLSYENTDQLSSDVVLAYADTQADADAFLKAPQDAALPAVADGHVAQLVGTQYIAAVSPPTALSLPWGLDALVSALASATK